MIQNLPVFSDDVWGGQKVQTGCTHITYQSLSSLQVPFPLGQVGLLKAWWPQAVGTSFLVASFHQSVLDICTKRKEGIL